MSSVLETISCLTCAGVGAVPWCDFSYAWMTSAATPAVSGEDWLVPPNDSTGAGLPARLGDPPNPSRVVEHNAQPDPPGAAARKRRPPESNPHERARAASRFV